MSDEQTEKLKSWAQENEVEAPAPVAGYLAFFVLAKAYGREGESENPDLAQHCAARCDMYEKIFEKYYGAGL